MAIGTHGAGTTVGVPAATAEEMIFLGEIFANDTRQCQAREGGSAWRVQKCPPCGRKWDEDRRSDTSEDEESVPRSAANAEQDTFPQDSGYSDLSAGGDERCKATPQ